MWSIRNESSARELFLAAEHFSGEIVIGPDLTSVEK